MNFYFKLFLVPCILLIFTSGMGKKPDGKRIKYLIGERETIEYKYNKSNQIETEIRKTWGVADTVKYEYDQTGRLINVYLNESELHSGMYRTYSYYLPERIEIKQFESDENGIYRERYVYDLNFYELYPDYATIYEYINKEKFIEGYARFEYSSKKQLQVMKYYDRKKKPIQQWTVNSDSSCTSFPNAPGYEEINSFSDNSISQVHNSLDTSALFENSFEYKVLSQTKSDSLFVNHSGYKIVYLK
ncbi:MAG: hypothetical protein SGJ04_01540 [Bacteroidota bacterium]|nr:hypothetical protein [Bacteroidota bacterium]